MEGELELSPNLIEQMYGCFACMACNELCPVGIRPADLALSMRQIQEQLHPAGWKQTLFQGLIPYPGRMDTVTWPLRVYQSLSTWSHFEQLCRSHIIPKIEFVKVKDLRPNIYEISTTYCSLKRLG